jgi:putative iron-dependent peroxidase
MSEPQAAIQAGPGRSALFLTLTVGAGEADAARVREVCASIPALVRSVGHRDEPAGLSCVVGLGAEAWERLAPGRGRPAQLHPFPALADGPRVAPSTPGDLLLHIRAERADFCHELARLIAVKLAGAATVVDETHGFAYMDSRDLTGFVDGTENPTGDERVAFTIVGDEDPDHAGGSYVTTQRYVTDFAKWSGVSTEVQEAAIGRTKADDIELDDASCPPSAHKERAKVVRDGAEQKILRHNRAYGTTAESGTYFIAYARDLSVTEEMLRRMFVADAAGTYDKLLDFTRAVTGTNFFAPARDVLETLGDAPAPVEAPADVEGRSAGGSASSGEPSDASPASPAGGSLDIGDLRPRGAA